MGETEVLDSHTDEDAQVIRQRLDEHNCKFVPPDNHERLGLVVKKDDKIIGGLLGDTYWHWLYIELFWVDEVERHNGLGTRICTQTDAAPRPDVGAKIG